MCIASNARFDFDASRPSTDRKHCTTYGKNRDSF